MGKKNTLVRGHKLMNAVQNSFNDRRGYKYDYICGHWSDAAGGAAPAKLLVFLAASLKTHSCHGIGRKVVYCHGTNLVRSTRGDIIRYYPLFVCIRGSDSRDLGWGFVTLYFALHPYTRCFCYSGNIENYMDWIITRFFGFALDFLQFYHSFQDWNENMLDYVFYDWSYKWF